MEFIKEFFYSIFSEFYGISGSELLASLMYFLVAYIALYFLGRKRVKNMQISIIFRSELDIIQEYGKKSYVNTKDQNKLLVASGYSVFANIVIWIVKFLLGLGFAVLFTVSSFEGSTTFLFGIPFELSLLETIKVGTTPLLIFLALSALVLQFMLNAYVEGNVLVSNSGVDMILLFVTAIGLALLPSGFVFYWIAMTLLEIAVMAIYVTFFWNKDIHKLRDSLQKEIDAYGMGLKMMAEGEKKKKKKNKK